MGKNDYLSWTKCLHYRRHILRLLLVVEGDSYGKVGEVLSVIAEKYNVGLSEVISWNSITDAASLRIGQEPTIYPGQVFSLQGAHRRSSSSSSCSSSSSKVIHTVKSGEVLSVIAEKYNVGLSQAISWNNITDAASLRIGQELTIYPGQSVFTSGAHRQVVHRHPRLPRLVGVIHTVKSGGVERNCREVQCGPSQVIGWNNITDAASLHIGQQLVIILIKAISTRDFIHSWIPRTLHWIEFPSCD